MYLDFELMSVEQCVSYVHYLVKSEAPDEGVSCNVFDRLLEQLTARSDSGLVSRDIMLSVVDIFHQIILQRQECPNVICVVLDYAGTLPHPELLLHEILSAVPVISNKKLSRSIFEQLRRLVLRAMGCGKSSNGNSSPITGSDSSENTASEKLLVHSVKIMIEMSPMLEDQNQLEQLIDAVDLVVGGDVGEDLGDTVLVELSVSVLNNLPASLGIADKLVHSFLQQVSQYTSMHPWMFCISGNIEGFIPLVSHSLVLCALSFSGVEL